MGLLEGNQLMFIVLLTLVFSAALRMFLAHGLHSSSRLPCESDREDFSGSGTDGRKGVGLRGQAWELPPGVISGFPNGGIVDPAKFRLSIKLLAFDRADSILRCLNSLMRAEYEGDAVDLDIFVDHTFDDRHHRWNGNSVRRVNISHELLFHLDTMPWPHGSKRVIYRARNQGLQPQWMEAWWPNSLNEFAFVVEDDLEVSPLFYVYLKRMLAAYYFDVANFSPRIYGASLQRQYFVTGIGGHSGTRSIGPPFLYQLVGTWGQLLFPGAWREFRLWYDMRRFNESTRPAIEGLKSTQWWYNKGNKLWTPWIIKWAHSRAMYNLYPSLPGNLSLSTSHRDKGSNFGQSRGPDAELVKISDLPEGALASLSSGSSGRKAKEEGEQMDWWNAFPALHSLKRHDLCFHVLPFVRVLRTVAEVDRVLEKSRGRAKWKRVSLVFIPPSMGFPLARNWLCHTEGAGLQSIILVTTCRVIASDLAAAGHWVFYLPPDASSTTSAGQQRTQLPEPRLPVEVEKLGRNFWTLGHLRLVKALLSLGHDVLVSNADVVWLGDPFDYLKTDSAFEAYGALDSHYFSDSFLIMRAKEGAQAAWGRLVDHWEAAEREQQEQRRRKQQQAGGTVEPGQDQVHATQRLAAGWFLGPTLSFKQLAGLPFVQGGPPALAKGMQQGLLPVVLLPSGLTTREQRVQALGAAGLWAVDDADHACKAVTCKRKLLTVA